MTADAVAALWREIFNSIPWRKFSFAEKEDIESLELEHDQFRYLMLGYGEQTPYPNVRDFIGWVETHLREETVPDPLSCTALLSGNPTFIQAVEDLEVLSGAWYPNEDTKAKIDELRNMLKEAFA